MPELVDRSHLVRMARLHHVANSMSAIYYGLPDTRWSGDASEGEHAYDNGQGDNFTIRWTESGLVALAFAHESERSEFSLPVDQRKPLAHLPDLPVELTALAEGVADDMERLVTAGIYAVGASAAGWSDAVTMDAWFAHGLEMLKGFVLLPEEAMFSDDFQNWAERFSLEALDGDDDQAYGRLAIRLAESTAHGPFDLSAEDERLLLLHPDATPISLANAALGADLLAQIGIQWRVDDLKVAAANERTVERLREAE